MYYACHFFTYSCLRHFFPSVVVCVRQFYAIFMGPYHPPLLLTSSSQVFVTPVILINICFPAEYHLHWHGHPLHKLHHPSKSLSSSFLILLYTIPYGTIPPSPTANQTLSSLFYSSHPYQIPSILLSCSASSSMAWPSSSEASSSFLILTLLPLKRPGKDCSPE